MSCSMQEHNTDLVVGEFKIDVCAPICRDAVRWPTKYINKGYKWTYRPVRREGSGGSIKSPKIFVNTLYDLPCRPTHTPLLYIYIGVYNKVDKCRVRGLGLAPYGQLITCTSQIRPNLFIRKSRCKTLRAHVVGWRAYESRLVYRPPLPSSFE